MSQQKTAATAGELWGYLTPGAQEIFEALGFDYLPSEAVNPVWEALAGLSPLSDEEITELVEAGELEVEEADQYRITQERGRESAEMLIPLVWKGKRANKKSIMLAHVVAQTNALNYLGGSIGTQDLASIRQRWYASKSPRAMGFKFAAQALERYLVKSADLVLVDGARSQSQAKRIGATNVKFKVNWSKEQEKALGVQLGRDPRIHVWPKEGWGRAYAQFQSQLFGDLVRGGLTYEKLWIEDISRDVKKSSPLVGGFKGVLMLEKQGLFPHFEKFCAALGIPVLIAASGNNAFAGVEAVLNDNFRDWGGRYTPTTENPLRLFVISDHDYAGMVPVQMGALAQFQRYLGETVVLHRVGVTRQQLKDLKLGMMNHGYIFESLHNSAYWKWATEVECGGCGIQWYPGMPTKKQVEDPGFEISWYLPSSGECPECGSGDHAYVNGIWIGDTCYGIEVEALVPSAYISYLVTEIIEALGGEDKFVQLILRLAEPEWYNIKSTLSRNLREKIHLYRMLDTLGDWVADRVRDIEQETESKINELVGLENSSPDYWDEPGVPPWCQSEGVKEATALAVEPQAEKITAENFAEYTEGAGTYSQAWRPVDGSEANKALVELFEDGGTVEPSGSWGVQYCLGDEVIVDGFTSEGDASQWLEDSIEDPDLSSPYSDDYEIVEIAPEPIEVEGHSEDLESWVRGYCEDNRSLAQAIDQVFDILGDPLLDDPIERPTE